MAGFSNAQCICLAAAKSVARAFFPLEMAYTAPVSMNADGCNSDVSIFKVMRLRILIEQGDGGGGGGGGGADGGVTPSIQLMRRLKETARVYVLT